MRSRGNTVEREIGLVIPLVKKVRSKYYISMIKAVIFDFGNVISYANTGDCALEMERMTGVPAVVYRSVYDEFRKDFDRGLITGAQLYAKTLSHNGYEELARNEALMKRIALMDLESWKAVRDDVTDWGLSLQKQGYKLGILSNMPFEFLELYEKDIKLFTHADHAVFSCRVKIIKPEKEIYLEVLRGLGVKPEEAVFFDDVQENIDAALSLGIHGKLWTGLENAQKDWHSTILKEEKN